MPSDGACVMVRLWMCLCGLGAASAMAAGPVDFATLLDEMTDLSGLARWPDPPFVCRQFSSYDRRSKRPDDREGWFANHDVDQFLRTERHAGRTEYVLADARGPGAIVRIWSANPRGTLRIYLDGSQTPVIEAPMTDYLSGKYPGVPEPIAHLVSKGWNCYLPIPYARSCKITSDERGFYYHVDYRTYAPGTRVRSLQRDDLKRYRPQIQAAARKLAEPALARHPAAQRLRRVVERQRRRWHTLARGEPYRWRTPEPGPGAIVGLHAAVRGPDIEQALRRVVLRMRFDQEPTVAVPLGDFFGTTPGPNAYHALPMEVDEDGDLWSWWVMPFEQNAEIELRNEGAAAVEVQLHVAVAPWTWDARSLHFHADWRAEFDVPVRPMRDWNYLTAAGQGVFVGAAFHMANPVPQWWGEGDEKIYVDGERFPSFFGTGTEDYYGYAWCWTELFSHAYHAQTRCDGPRNYGHTSVNRWHILDRIPFRRSFRFDMELWHWNEKARVAMSVATYWYARPGARSQTPPIEPAMLRVTKLGPYRPPRVPGALEGEALAILRWTAGRLEHQNWDGLSNEQHLWWTGARPGARLVVAVPAARAGRYRVLARFLTAPDYGICRLSVNGQPAGGPIDLYHPSVQPSEEYELGVFELHKGQNELSVEIVGRNPRAVDRYMFGLDYVRLVPVEGATQPARRR